MEKCKQINAGIKNGTIPKPKFKGKEINILKLTPYKKHNTVIVHYQFKFLKSLELYKDLHYEVQKWHEKLYPEKDPIPITCGLKLNIKNLSETEKESYKEFMEEDKKQVLEIRKNDDWLYTLFNKRN